MTRLSTRTVFSSVARVYGAGERVPSPLKNAAVAGLDGLVALEVAAGRNTIPVTVGGRRLEFVYTDAPSFLYLTLSIGEDAISHEVPYSMLELPSRYDLGIDVGAHFGTYSVLLGALNAFDLVCFEPSERNRRVLAANLIHNGIDATVDDRVVTGADGEVAFYEGRKLASNDHTTRPAGAGVREASTRPAVSLSTIIEEADASAVFVKIDAEGEEDGILGDLVSSDVELLTGLVEIHPELLEGEPADVIRRLTDAGFRVETAPSIGNPVYRFTNDPALAFGSARSGREPDETASPGGRT